MDFAAVPLADEDLPLAVEQRPAELVWAGQVDLNARDVSVFLAQSGVEFCGGHGFTFGLEIRGRILNAPDFGGIK